MPTATPKISFEFFPPKTPELDAKLWAAVSGLAPLKPRFISVTYGAGGSTQARTQAIAARIHQETALRTAAHLTCVGASRTQVDAVARGYWQAGIHHVVALRGDPPSGTGRYRPHAEGYTHAADLVSGLKRIADFEISVAAYPETHTDATSPAADLEQLRRKVDAGAARAITQFFFEADYFLRFLDRVRAAGIEVPVVAGILPVNNFAQVARFSAGCGATVPDWMVRRFEGLDDDPERRQEVATEVGVRLCRALYDQGVDEFHFYTTNRSEIPIAICAALGVDGEAEAAAASPSGL